MKHVYAIIIKFIMVMVVLGIALYMLTDLSFQEIFVISAIVTVVSYLLCDLLILAVSNNTIATIADVVLTFIILYSLNNWSNYGYIDASTAAISAVVLGVGDWFFHKYMAKSVYDNHHDKSIKH